MAKNLSDFLIVVIVIILQIIVTVSLLLSVFSSIAGFPFVVVVDGRIDGSRRRRCGHVTVAVVAEEVGLAEFPDGVSWRVELYQFGEFVEFKAFKEEGLLSGLWQSVFEAYEKVVLPVVVMGGRGGRRWRG